MYINLWSLSVFVWPRLIETAKMCRSGRSDPQLLTKKPLRVHLEAQIKLYFGMIDKDDTSPISLGETFNAFLRVCVLLCYFQPVHTKKRKLDIKLSQLEEDIWRQCAENAAYHPLSNCEISSLKLQISVGPKEFSPLLCVPCKHVFDLDTNSMNWSKTFTEEGI